MKLCGFEVGLDKPFFLTEEMCEKQLRAWLRAEGARRMPIIAVTANAMSTDRDLALAAGMNDHLAKPLTRDGLAATVLKWTRPDDSR